MPTRRMYSVWQHVEDDVARGACPERGVNMPLRIQLLPKRKFTIFFVFYFLNKNLVAAEPIPFNSMVVAFVSESGKQICNIFSFTDRASLSNMNMTHRRYAVW